MATFLDLATAALQDLGVIAAGEAPTSADAELCRTTCNRLIDIWAAERLTIYEITRSTWTISASDGTYTVGSGGDIAIAWPQYIHAVRYQDTSQSPTLELSLTALTDDAWAGISEKTETSTLPSSWYFDRNYPLGNLQLWPVPTSSTLQGVIYAPTAVTSFSATSTAVSLPPGYEELLVKSMAARLASAFDRMSMKRDLMEEAEEAKRRVKVPNFRLRDLTLDAGAVVGHSGYYDIYTGQ